MTLLRSGKTNWRDTGDAELVAACLDGDQIAWEELVERFSRLVYSVPARYGLPQADADDVFAGVFAILYRKLSTIRDADRLAAWLIRTTHRECMRVAAAAKARPGPAVDVPGSEEPAEDELMQWERTHLVRQALRRLGGRCQDLLTMLFLTPGPPSYDTVAEQLGMRVGSIGPTRARCFAKLEKILAELGLEEAAAAAAPQRAPDRQDATPP